jgi:hypothetical protein
VALREPSLPLSGGWAADVTQTTSQTFVTWRGQLSGNSCTMLWVHTYLTDCFATLTCVCLANCQCDDDGARVRARAPLCPLRDVVGTRLHHVACKCSWGCGGV